MNFFRNGHICKSQLSGAGQINNELEHRIGLMENNLSRLGRILDSVQGDIMQVNKSVKDVALESK